MILLIDNHDSFTFNLAQYLQKLDQMVLVKRNNEIRIKEIQDLSPSHIILSPGPGRPENAENLIEIVQSFYQTHPILGICLGHQAIAYAFGGKIQAAVNVVHGKTSRIHHQKNGIFTDIPSPFSATRYHSLIVDHESLPNCLTITAWTQNNNRPLSKLASVREVGEGSKRRTGVHIPVHEDSSTEPTNKFSTEVELQKRSNNFEEIMGVAHTQLPVYGVQFHPEAILSEYGLHLLKNFIEYKKLNL